MFLSREIVTMCQNYTKHTYVCKILYKIRSIKQIIFSKYGTNLKTTISQRSLRNSSLILLLLELNNFSFLIDLINNIIYASGTGHRNTNQWQCSIIVTCLTYQNTALPRSGHVIRTYILHIYVLV